MGDLITPADPFEEIRALTKRLEVLERTARFPTAPTQVLGWQQVDTDILGINATGLPWPSNWQPLGHDLTVTVGENRVLFIETQHVFQKHTNKGAIELAIYLDGASSPLQSSQIIRTLESVDGTTDDYVTMTLGIPYEPAAGDRRFRVAAAPDNDSMDYYSKTASDNLLRNYLMVLDIGPV